MRAFRSFKNRLVVSSVLPWSGFDDLRAGAMHMHPDAKLGYMCHEAPELDL
jgi:hypothetical protein